MYCTEIIRDELDKVISTLCYKQTKELSVIAEKCWEKQCSENKYHVIVCTNCGYEVGCERMKEFCSFHDNKCKMIYFRKYYLNKVMLNLTKKYNIMTTTNKNKIIAVLEKTIYYHRSMAIENG